MSETGAHFEATPDVSVPAATADVVAPPSPPDVSVPTPGDIEVPPLPPDVSVPTAADHVEAPIARADVAAPTTPPDVEVAIAHPDVSAPAAPADVEVPIAPPDVAAPAAPAGTEMPGAHTDHAPAVPVAASAPARSALFGPALLLPGEDPRNYDQLLGSTYAAVKPKDFLEEMYVDAISYVTWEYLRLRRMNAALLATTVVEELSAIIQRFYSRLENADALLCQWTRAEPAAIKRISILLTQVGLNIDAVMAKALAKRVDEFERIGRMIGAMEARRTATFWEIERHRATLAPRLRQATERIEDAEFTTVERDSGASKNSQ